MLNIQSMRKSEWDTLTPRFENNKIASYSLNHNNTMNILFREMLFSSIANIQVKR